MSLEEKKVSTNNDNNEEFEFCAACQIGFGCEISQPEPEPENKENEEVKACKKCEFWDEFKNEPDKGVCKNPVRKDKKSVHYYGYIKADDYCAKFSKKVGK